MKTLEIETSFACRAGAGLVRLEIVFWLPACAEINTDTIKPGNKMAPACYRLLLTAQHQSAGKPV